MKSLNPVPRRVCLLLLLVCLPTLRLSADEAETNPFTVATNSYLGGVGDHEVVTGAEVQSDGTIVLTAILGNAQPGGISPILVNGASTSSDAAILRLTSDGQTVLSVTRTGDELWDISLDDNDNIYVAAGLDGLLKLNPAADAVIFQRKAGTFVGRVDAARNGDVAVLAPISYGPDDIDGRRIEHNKPGAGWIHAYDAGGTLITEFKTIGGRDNTDVAIYDGGGNPDDARIAFIGWRQAYAYVGAVGGGCGDPFVMATQGMNVTVHIGLLHGVTYNYDGTNPEEIAYKMYDRPARPEDLWLPTAPTDLKLRRQEHINPQFFNGPTNVSDLYTAQDIEDARNDALVWNDWLWIEEDAGNSFVGSPKNIIYAEAHAWYMQGVPSHASFIDEAFRYPGWCATFDSPDLIGLVYSTGGNNMADTRGLRIAMGRDDKLYAMFESAGGNTETRWHPSDLTQSVPKPGADLYHQFLNIADAHAITFLRYEPVTGEPILRQEFAPNYVNSIGQTISNTVRAKGADITADEAGRVYITGASAGELPIPLADNFGGVTGFNPYPDGTYLGGAYLVIMNPQMSGREYATRLTPNGWGHTVAARIVGDPATDSPIVVYGGREDLVEPLWLKNAVQPFPGYGTQDGFYAVLGGDELGADLYQIAWGLNNRTSTSRLDYRDTLPVHSVIDASGNGLTDDAVSGWPFSDTVPLSPSEPGYTGIPYYGGMQAVRLASAPDNFWNMSRTGAASSFDGNGDWRRDTLDINPINVYETSVLVYFDKKDFTGISGSDRLSFSASTSQHVRYVPDFSWHGSHFVVREGDTFYVSEVSALEDRNRAYTGMLTFTDDFDHGRWAVYDPASSLYFDEANAVFATRTFTDITGFGVLVNRRNEDNNAGLWGRLSQVTMQFEINNVASRRPTAVIQQSRSYLNPGQYVLMDGSSSTDPDGTVSFFTWEQQNDADTLIAGPVVSFDYDAPGNYKPVLRVFDDQTLSGETSTRLWVGPDPALGADPDRVVAAYSGVKSIVDLRGRNSGETGLDLNGNGQATDSWLGAAFSETQPVESRQGSTSLYGGLAVRFYDGSDPQLNRWEWRERFWVHVQSRPANIHGTLFVDKTDFLNGGEYGTVVLGSGDYLDIEIEENTLGWPLRWLVRDGDSYYVSQGTFNAIGDHRYNFSGANDGQWALYDPAADLDFDAAAATFSPRTFNNVTALGVVVDQDTIRSESQIFQISRFMAEATITPMSAQPPAGSFTWSPASPGAGDVVTFDASASTDDFTITSVRWDFEDGGAQQSDGAPGSPAALTAPYVFSEAGVHEVTLTLTNELGLSSSVTQNVTVAGDTRTRARIVASPETGFVPLTVNFDAGSSTATAGSTLVQYDWSFGDGVSLVDGGVSTNHAYGEPGSYNATVTVTDSAGVTSTATTWVSVAAAPAAQPTASFTATPETGKNPLTVVFDASASTAGSGELVNTIWNFSDGSSASGPVVEKTYPDHGVFPVYLSVLNSQGKVNSAEMDIVVTENLLPVAEISASVVEGGTPLQVQFNASASSDPDGTVARYDWNFGDGGTLEDGGPTTAYTYVGEGAFTASVTVTDDTGGTDTAEVLVRAVDLGDAPLMYHYTFDFGAGSVVEDVSGFGEAEAAVMVRDTTEMDLRDSAFPSPQGGAYGEFASEQRNQLNFDGTKWNSVVAGPEGSGGFTVSMLLRDLNPNNTGVTRDRPFFRENTALTGLGLYHGSSTDASSLPLILRVNSTTDIPLGTGANLTNASTGDSDGWILLAFTYDSPTDTARVFVGREYSASEERWTQLEQVGSDVTIPTNALNTVAALQFGNSSSRSPRALYDDFRIYSRALLPVELAGAVTMEDIAPTITAHPESMTVPEGDTVTLEAAALGQPAPTFQWLKDGTPVVGATSFVLTLENVALSDAGTYTLEATNSLGSANSDGAVLTVQEAGTLPEEVVIIDAATRNGSFESHQTVGDLVVPDVWTTGFNVDDIRLESNFSPYPHGDRGLLIGHRSTSPTYSGAVMNTAYVVGAGDTFDLSFHVRAGWQWDANEQIAWRLFTTSDDTAGGVVTEIASGFTDGLNGGTWEGGLVSLTGLSGVGPDNEGRELWIEFRPENTGANSFAQLDQVTLVGFQQTGGEPPPPPPPSESVEIYSVPPGEVVNTDYTVKVNGQPVPVIESGHSLPGSPDDRRVYAHFSFEGTVEIEVTGLQNHTLLPEQYGIEPTVNDGQRIVFTLDRPRYMILSRGSGQPIESSLFLFADMIDPQAPNPDAPEVLNYADFAGGGGISGALTEVAQREDLDVLYIPPGTWESGGVIEMQSNVTLYVAGGARINNGLVRFQDVENANVRGRGVLEFNRSTANNFSYGIYGLRSQNIRVEGLITRTAHNWNTVMHLCEQVEILYLKVLNSAANAQ